MTLINRHLEKLINIEAREFIDTNEDIGLLVETLLNLRKLRKVREFLYESLRVNLDFSPAVYNQLLEIPGINVIETPTKMGEVKRTSLKEKRQPKDPVSVADLNAVLKELNRDFSKIHERLDKEFSKRLLTQDITLDLIEPCVKWVTDLKMLSQQKMGYLLSPLKIKKIEDAFQQAFPNSTGAHLLRSTWPKIEYELEFYIYTRKIEEKWSILPIDLFAILKTGKIFLVLQNIQEMGSLLWNSVYNGKRLEKSFRILEIQFMDMHTLFENKNFK